MSRGLRGFLKKLYGWQPVGFIARNGKPAAAKAILVCHFF